MTDVTTQAASASGDPTIKQTWRTLSEVAGPVVYLTTGSTVTVASTSEAADGAAAPATGGMIGGFDGTNLQYIRTDSSGNLTVQGVSGGQPMPIAGQTANTVASAANPFPVALYIPGGTTGLSVSGTNTDTLSTSGTSARLEANAVFRMVNAAGSMSRAYQIDAVTASGTGVQAVAMAGSSYANLTASGLVKTGAGILQNIVVNTPGAGTITVWANTSAATTKIGTIAVVAGQAFTLPFNTYFTTGLYVEISGTMDITVNYR